MTDADTSMLGVARRYYEAGLAVIPPKEDGTKRPIDLWKQYQAERPDPATLKGWYRDGRDGIGCITGEVSGNLELFEFDFYPTYLAFCEVGEKAGMGDLIARIDEAYAEATPNGGVHWYYRCDTIAGNTKLAQRNKTPEEMKHPEDRIKTLIETRGNGGFSIMAPSHGKVHDTGFPYEVLRGRVEDIPTITPEERKLLWDLARTFHELHIEFTARPASPVIDGDRPGDLFGRQVSWSDILEPHGWRRVFSRGQTTHWRRPGKDIGTSATTGHTDRDTLMVFTTSTAFDPVPNSYTKFAAYALLNYKGDQSAAARELWKAGYRSGGVAIPKPPTTRTDVDPDTGEIIAPPEKISPFRRVLVGEAITEGIPEPEWLIDGIFFRESVCLFYGEGGSGKTMLLLALIRDAIAAGHRVLFIDEEGGIKLVGARLRDMGVDPAALDEYLYYYPFSGFNSADVDLLVDLVEEVYPALVVFDAMSELLSNSGVRENENSEVTHWMTTVPFRLARHTTPRPAVVVIDHIAKNTESTSGPRGASQKKNIADYQWFAKQVEEFDHQTVGKMKLTNTKNRFGNLPESHTFIIGGRDGTIICERFDLSTHPAKAIPSKAEIMLRTIYEEGPKGNAELRSRLNVSDTTVAGYVTLLTNQGVLERVGEGRSVVYQLTPNGIAKVGEKIAKVGDSHSPSFSPTHPPPKKGGLAKKGWAEARENQEDNEWQ